MCPLCMNNRYFNQCVILCLFEVVRIPVNYVNYHENIPPGIKHLIQKQKTNLCTMQCFYSNRGSKRYKHIVFHLLLKCYVFNELTLHETVK